MSRPRLSLDSLTLTDTSPGETIRAAARAGYELVSLWTVFPSIYPRQLLSAAMERDCAVALADNGVKAHSLEAFDLTTADAVLAARPGMEIGARLGAEAVLALHYANPDRSQAADVLGFLAQEARRFGLGVNLEPVAMGYTRTLAQAAALIDAAGVDAGILFDTYHFARVGGQPADIAAIRPGLLRYVQVGDGLFAVPEADWAAESLQERLYPGRGEFPLVEMLRRLPTGIPWAIEAPSLRRATAGVSAEARAQEAYQALTAVVGLALAG